MFEIYTLLFNSLDREFTLGIYLYLFIYIYNECILYYHYKNKFLIKNLYSIICNIKIYIIIKKLFNYINYKIYIYIYIYMIYCKIQSYSISNHHIYSQYY